MRKSDEMEQYQANQAGKFTFIFYTLALLVYSIYHYLNTGELGIPFIIFIAGQVVYFASTVYYRNKMS